MAESQRLSALKKLSAQIPVANTRVAQGQQAARDMQLQQAVKQAPSSMGTAQAQQVGAQQAATAGQQQLATQEAGLQQQGQVAELATQAVKQQQQTTLSGLEQGVEQQRQSNVEKFAQLSQEAKQEMFDSRIQFQRDEMGRIVANERQLADFARLQAKNDDEFKNYAQQSQQAHQFKIQALETVQKRLEATLKSNEARKQEGLDRISDQQILQMQQDVERQLEKARADAAKKSALYTMGGTVLGAAGGALIGGPTGATTGAQVGGGAGALAAAS